MTRYILQRLLLAIPTLLAASICVFLLLQAIPGGPLTMYENNPLVTVEDIERLKKTMGLDGSPIVQYGRWLQNVLKGDIGWSLVTHRPVLPMIVERLPNTFLLVGTAFIVSLMIAIPIGMLSAIRQYSIFDHIATGLAFVGQAVPIFWLGLMLIIVFSLQLKWFPAGGMMTIGAPFSILDRIKHLLLPAMMMGTALAGRYIRFVRGSVLEVINEDYVRTAHAKGLSEKAILWRHVFKNAAIPIVTVLSLDLPMLFSGALYTEVIFSWPGMGRLFFDAAERRDYPVLMAMILTTAALVIFFNLVADIVYSYLDPRIRYE